MKIDFLGVRFANPIVLASGILGVTAASLKRCIDLGAGGVTIKSLSLKSRTGHRNPTMGGYDHFFLNAVGLSNPGIEAGIKEIKKFKKICHAPLIGSVFAGNVAEFGIVTKRICSAPIDILEIDISCPNVGEEFDTPFAYSVEAAVAITKVVKKYAKRVPVSMKLSPNAWNIGAIAAACEQAGADAITAINTASGMTIDSAFQAPFLSNTVGGVSGPALKPIALKAVWDVYNSVKRIPIIATGGVTSGEDAAEMMLAGGTLVGVGSAVFWRGPDVFGKIVAELKQYMKQHNMRNVKSIIGKAHKSRSA
ncbi:MAG: dihydroorotate dehydrogenase [Candidatus Kerfeldbacteria bacterium]|nr:dihydroorotate dehydrogenase [Candidatus Kerfeldbacteria bacterium]